MRKLNKWTEKQIGYALKLRKQGKSMNQIYSLRVVYSVLMINRNHHGIS